MATITSNPVTGNASSGSSWVGGVAPTTGDTIVVVPGADITIDVNLTLGSKASNVGHAFTAQGTNATTYGKLRVAAGVTLTLRGTDKASNTLGVVNRYGLFAPAAGSTVLGDVASDYASVILNSGRFEAIGTSGSRITLSVPSGSVNWAASQASKAFTWYQYDTSGPIKIAIACLDNVAVSNAAHTGLGSVGDSSISVTANTLQAFGTERSSLAGIVAAGDYYVDYDSGALYVGTSTFTAGKTVTLSHYYLDKSSANWRGWGICSIGNTDNTTCLTDYCDFKYMGTTGVGLSGYRFASPVNWYGHLSAGANSGSATRLARCTYSTFNYGYGYIQLQNCSGKTDGTDQLLITNNTFNEASGTISGSAINVYYVGTASYVTLDSNAINSKGSIVSFNTMTSSCSGWRITNNTGYVPGAFVTACGSPWATGTTPDAASVSPNPPCTPDLYVAGNTLRGAGQAAPGDRTLIVSGTSGHPCIVENNRITSTLRLGSLYGSYVTYRKNVFGTSYHHGFTGSDANGVYCSDTTFENNLFYCDRGSSGSTGAAIELGYNHICRAHNFVVSNNTFDGWIAAIDLSDSADQGFAYQHTSNLSVVNNIFANGGYVLETYSTASSFANQHVLEFDYNVCYNPVAYAQSLGSGGSTGLNNTTCSTGFYQGSNKYNRLTGASRNVNGVALFDASYTTAQTGRSLAYTVNTLGQDHTLSWGGGTAQQLILDYGTSSGGGYRSIGVTGKTDWAFLLTGTITTTNGSATVTGSGTAFTTEVAAGDYIRANGTSNICYKVASIASDTSLTLTAAAVVTASAKVGVRIRKFLRTHWLWVVSGTGSGQARSIWSETPNTAISVSIVSGGGGWVVGDCLQALGGTTDIDGSAMTLRVTSVSGGVITGLTIVNGGAYTTVPTGTISMSRVTGNSGTGATVTATWAPGLLILPDLSTGLDATSVYAVVKSMVNLPDSSTGSVWAGLCLPTPGSDLTSVQLPTTSQTDTGITVAVNHSPTTSPSFVGAASYPTGVATDYKWASGSAKDAGTSDNAASTDYFGTSRPQGAAYDIGFYEAAASGSLAPLIILRSGRAS